MACQVYNTVKKPIISLKKTEAVVLFVLKKLDYAAADVSVHLIGDTRMRRLNREYRGKDTTTDVLSFGTEDDEGNDLGDMFISIPRIRSQAKEFNVSIKEEYVRMLIHGVLHLIGYEHYTKKDAEEMFTLQEAYVLAAMNTIV